MASAGSVQLEAFEVFAKPLVESGKYRNLDEVLAAAVVALAREEAGQVPDDAWLIDAIEEGETSGIAEGDVITRVLTRAGLPIHG